MPLDACAEPLFLSSGHHDPGSGKQCLLEAAVAIAGFPATKVDEVHKLPPCFSWPIARYAMNLNDDMPDDLRNERRG